MVIPTTRAAVSVQYPHYLFVLSAPTLSEQDETGAWCPAQTAWVYAGRCREEPNGKGATIRTAGGEYITFTSTIYLPQGAPDVPVGAEVMATTFIPEDAATEPTVHPENVRIKGRCVGYDAGRLHSRLWV